MSVPIQTLSTLQPLTASNTNFGTNLFNVVAQGGDQNIFFSPSSIATTARMLMNGAGGSSLQALQQNFGIAGQPSLQTLNELEKGLREALASSELPGKMQLKTANAIWIGPVAKPNPKFVSVAREYYGAEVGSVKPGDEAMVNRWVSDNTAGMIREILSRGSITGLTALLLGNAIYFKGQWLYQFEPMNTRNQDFFTTGKKTTVPMMHLNQHFRYLEFGGLQMIKLPYQGRNDSDISMIIALPQRNMSPNQFASEYKSALAGNIEGLNSARTQKVELSMPKFKLDATLNLRSAFIAMGMGDLFDRDNARLCGLVEASDNIYISEAIHRAVVDVNEEGTEAAAATVMHLRMRGMAPRPVQMVIDHPFLFMIEKGATPLFMGWMARP